MCRTTRWTASTDDYFYPTTDAAVDAAQFAASGAANLAAWRRQNVTALVAKVYRTVKAADPTLRFGISPQGNPDNDLDQQYSDVTAWLAAGGEEKVIDYLCPQVYWGYGFTLQSGSTRFAFENIVPAWLSYPRAGDVALYFGLGAYRVGTGDGGANPDSVSGWSTGSALAAQVKDLRQQAAGGWALYRYGSLFGPEAPALAEAECAALRALNT
ncbi:MAG: family 10 glycosylhydrolase [Faecalibacterium prausnitzii]|nr:family 10 glycosylhydrolase [Faecalibacterium prausnitzii]